MLLTYILQILHYCDSISAVQSDKYHNIATIKHSFILGQSIAAVALKFSALLYADFHYALLFININPRRVILSLKQSGSSHIVSMRPFCQYTIHICSRSCQFWDSNVCIRRQENQNKVKFSHDCSRGGSGKVNHQSFGHRYWATVLLFYGESLWNNTQVSHMFVVGKRWVDHHVTLSRHWVYTSVILLR
jgi:hypothetical protein